MPRFLISGGAGFIGSNLALELESQGAEVVVVDSFRTGNAVNLDGFQGRFIQGDVCEQMKLEGPWDAVFHHGDITDPRHGDDAEVLEKNIAGFRHMLDTALQAKCRLVYASTAGLYGNGPTPMREDQPKELLTAYGKSKLQMDEMAFRYGKESPVVGLRYFNVYGPREASKGRAASMIYHLYQQVKAGKRPRIFEWGEQKRDFIYVKDVVRANLAAMTSPSGVFNVGTGVASTFNDLIAALGEALNKKLEPEYFPMPYDPKTYQGNTHADTTLAARELGFEAKWDFKSGVKDYVNWLERNPK